MIAWRRATCRLVLGASTGIAVACSLLLALYLVELLPAGPIRSNLQRSFQEGSLQTADWLRGNRAIGNNQYNDCLLVQMSQFSQDRWTSAVAPTVVFNNWPVPLTTDGQPMTECRIAKAAVFSDRPLTLYPAQAYFGYSRYLHAYRIPFTVLVSATTVRSIRATYSGLAIAVLGAVALASLRRASVSSRAANRRAAEARFGFAWLSVCFLLFYGLDQFSQSLTHGPADLLIYATLALFAFAPSKRGFPSHALVASLGALAFGLEFLHGTLPLLLAVILGALALRCYEQDRPVTLGEALWVVLAYGAGVAGAAAVKLFAVAITTGPEGMAAYFGQLRLRMAGGDASHFDAFKSLLGNLDKIAWGTPALGIAAVALAFVATCIALTRLIRGRVDHSHASGALLLLLASMAVIAVWYAIFRNHTALHGAFMVRLLVWPIAVGPLCWFLTRRKSDGGEPERRTRAMQAPSATVGPVFP